MGRKIGEHKVKQILEAHEGDKEALGPLLGKLVIEGNVPIEAVAELVHVSGTTVYRWMYGESHPGHVYESYIKKLLTILRKAKRAKQFPLVGTTKERIKQMGQLVIEHRPPISR